MDDQHIRCISFDHHQTFEGGVQETIIKDSLQSLLDSSNYPVLVTCKLGRHLTGVVVGCLRKYQRWAFASIFEEYRRFAGTSHQQHYEQFIELFDTDLVSPSEESTPQFIERNAVKG